MASYSQGQMWGFQMPSVTEDNNLSHDDQLLAEYIVNNLSTLDPSHNFGPSGSPINNAGKNSNIYASFWDPNPSEISIINEWGFSVFHGLPILNARLKKVGWGYYGDPSKTLKSVAALNVTQGIDGAADPGYPIFFPADNLTTSRSTCSTSELPDPRTTCPGYAGILPGMPISVQVGPGNVTADVAGSLLFNGTRIEACLIHEHNYTSPYPVGRQILSACGGVVLLPRFPLANGQYEVNISGVKLWGGPPVGWKGHFRVEQAVSIPATPAA